MTDLLSSAEASSTERCVFDLHEARRVDPTERVSLISVSGRLRGTKGLAEPTLLVQAEDGMKVVTPLWSSHRNETWAAEFAFASSRLADDGARLVLLLPDGHLFYLPIGHPELPIDEPEPERLSRTIALGLAAICILGFGGWAVERALHGDGSDATTRPRAGAGSISASPQTGAPVRRRLTPATAVASTPAGSTLVAHAAARRVGLYRSSKATKAWTFVHNPTVTGAPAVFMVRKGAGNRFKVALPIRPNGSTAWVRAVDVRLTRTNFRVDVDLTRHRLTAWRGTHRVMQTPIGTGRSVTPTPSGVYYVAALLKQPNPNGLFGPYAFALSGHSTVFTEFDGGNGRIGIHGTNQPSGIGANVSHGCIRVANVVIRRLARQLPLGTPVRISRSVSKPGRSGTAPA